MPYIEIKAAGSLTAEQKKEIVKQITKTMQDVAGKPPSATYIVIQEIERSDWGVGGKMLSEG